MKSLTAQQIAAKPTLTLTASTATVVIPKKADDLHKSHRNHARVIGSRRPMLGMVDKVTGQFKAKHVDTETATEITMELDPRWLNDIGEISYLIEGVAESRGIVVMTADTMHLSAIAKHLRGYEAEAFAVEQADETYAVGTIEEIAALLS